MAEQLEIPFKEFPPNYTKPAENYSWMLWIFLFWLPVAIPCLIDLFRPIHPQ